MGVSSPVLTIDTLYQPSECFAEEKITFNNTKITISCQYRYIASGRVNSCNFSKILFDSNQEFKDHYYL